MNKRLPYGARFDKKYHVIKECQMCYHSNTCQINDWHLSYRHLFKAKLKNWEHLSKKEQWVQGLLTKMSGQLYIIDLNDENTAYPIDGCTICQCTGSIDKNDNLIWEHDVIKCIDRHNDLKFYAVVRFGNLNGSYSCGYQLHHIKGDEPPNLDIHLWLGKRTAGVTIEIIDSIFDDPELPEVMW